MPASSSSSALSAAAIDPLLERALAGEQRAIARLLSRVEDGGGVARAILARIFPRTGRALVVGLTGPPGVGKSSLTDRLVAHYRVAGLRVAIVAVDPTSPFSGGAILGDRIRMTAHFTDPGVFIRSMATRGHLGGLAAATADIVDVLDAVGFERVLVETIGVGQDDIEVTRVAATTLLVTTPGLGDEIQVMKSGIMEAGDIYVINKADLPGADRIEAAMHAALSGAGLDEVPPILRTVASSGTGVAELAAAIDELTGKRPADLVARRRLLRAEERLHHIVEDSLLRRMRSQVVPAAMWQEQAARIARRECDPYTASDAILAQAGVPAAGGV